MATQHAGCDVYGWGSNEFGQLALPPTTASSPSPGLLTAISSRDVYRLAVGEFHTAAISEAGELFMCGRNARGQLGLAPDSSGHSELNRIEALATMRVTHLSCGESHTVVLLDNGSIATYGNNEFGQLGHGDTVSRSVPRIVKAPDGQPPLPRFSAVAAAGNHTLCLTDDGEVYTFGQGTQMQLGHGDNRDQLSPRLVQSLFGQPIIQVAAGSAFSAALTVTGRVYVWGMNKHAQLGTGDREHKTWPTLVQSLRHETVMKVVCGEQHTLALTEDGRVFAWGSARFGALGLGKGAADKDLQLLPKLVADLVHYRVSDIAAGSKQSMFVTSDQRVFATGFNAHGQLGVGDSETRYRPTEVKEVRGKRVRRIFAGASHTLALTQARSSTSFKRAASLDSFRSPYPIPPQVSASNLDTNPPSSSASTPGASTPDEVVQRRRRHHRISSIDLSMLRDMVASCKKKRDFAPLISLIETIFSSPGALNASFLRKSHVQRRRGLLSNLRRKSSPSSSAEAAPSSGRNASPPPPALMELTPQAEKPDFQLDIESVREAYDLLISLKQPNVTTAVMTATERLVQRKFQSFTPFAAPGVDSLRMFFIVLENPLLDNPAYHAKICEWLSRIIAAYARTSQALFVSWFQDYPSDRFRKLVNLFKNVITSHMQLRNYNFTLDITGPCNVLSLLYLSNENALGGAHVPYNAFYHPVVGRKIDLEADYIRWRKGAHAARKQFSFCHYPFLLDPVAKSRLLEIDATSQQRHEMVTSVLQGGRMPYLTIVVRRNNIIQDALSQIGHLPISDLKRPLKVKFHNEEAVDDGGVRKEFFQLLIKGLFSLDYGMFTYNEETRQFWFAPSLTADTSQDYYLVGLVMGLAIYNSVILDVRFPLVIYRKLMGETPGFEDLEDMNPELYRGLKSLLEFDGDVEEVFARTFQIDVDHFGNKHTIDLKPNGASIMVNKDNRHEFVRLYVNYLLTDSIEAQFSQFSSGFLRVAGGHPLQLFRAEELEQLICGSPFYNFDDLEKVTRYDAGYSPTHPVIKNFWAIVKSWDDEKKKKLLQFTTGSDRVPIGGLSNMLFVIQRAGSNESLLPTTHTCYNILMLPEYKSKKTLEEKLNVALRNSEGFGFI